MGRIGIAAVFVLAVGCAEESLPEAAPQGPALGTLRTRDADLRMEPTGAGPRFSVYPRHGGEVEYDLTEAELSSRYRDLYRVYRSAQAKNAFVDARLDPPVNEAPLIAGPAAERVR